MQEHQEKRYDRVLLASYQRGTALNSAVAPYECLTSAIELMTHQIPFIDVLPTIPHQ